MLSQNSVTVESTLLQHRFPKQTEHIKDYIKMPSEIGKVCDDEEGKKSNFFNIGVYFSRERLRRAYELGLRSSISNKCISLKVCYHVRAFLVTLPHSDLEIFTGSLSCSNPAFVTVLRSLPTFFINSPLGLYSDHVFVISLPPHSDLAFSIGCSYNMAREYKTRKEQSELFVMARNVRYAKLLDGITSAPTHGDLKTLIGPSLDSFSCGSSFLNSSSGDIPLLVSFFELPVPNLSFLTLSLHKTLIIKDGMQKARSQKLSTLVGLSISIARPTVLAFMEVGQILLF